MRRVRYQVACSLDLYGGGALFSRVLAWDLVDTVEPAIVLASPSVRSRLTLMRHQAYPSGLVLLEYRVQNDQSGQRDQGGTTP